MTRPRALLTERKCCHLLANGFGEATSLLLLHGLRHLADRRGKGERHFDGAWFSVRLAQEAMLPGQLAILIDRQTNPDISHVNQRVLVFLS